MSDLGGWWREVEGGAELTVRLTPRAARDGLEAPEQGADGRFYLRARVRAVPEDGKANAALVKLIAEAAGVAKSNVEIRTGATSRMKTLFCRGEAERLIRAIEGTI